jgi:predicted RNA methylase
MTLEAWLAGFFFLGFTALWLSIVWPGLAGAPWLPSRRRDVRRMLKLAEVEAEDVVYDLGSGDGRVLIAAARDFEARAVGIEIEPLKYLWTKLRLRWSGVSDRARVVWGNFFSEDLSGADVVIVYLRQDTNNRLMHKLWHELRPGTRVVTNTFIFPGWEVVRMDPEAHLFLYRIRPHET